MIERIFGSSAARANWLVGFLCVAWLLALLQASVPDNDLLEALWSQTMAAWVQAVGSVLAILAAVSISRWETERARLDKRQDRRELRLAVAALARRLADKIAAEADDMKNNPEYYHYEGMSVSDYNLLDAAIGRFDPSQLVSAEAVIALEEIRRSGRSAGFYADLVTEDYRQETYVEDLKATLDSWAEGASAAATTLERVASAD